jgi:hypothetical protein
MVKSKAGHQWRRPDVDHPLWHKPLGASLSKKSPNCQEIPRIKHLRYKLDSVYRRSFNFQIGIGHNNRCRFHFNFEYYGATRINRMLLWKQIQLKLERFGTNQHDKLPSQRGYRTTAVHLPNFHPLYISIHFLLSLKQQIDNCDSTSLDNSRCYRHCASGVRFSL